MERDAGEHINLEISDPHHVIDLTQILNLLALLLSIILCLLLFQAIWQELTLKTHPNMGSKGGVHKGDNPWDVDENIDFPSLRNCGRRFLYR